MSPCSGLYRRGATLNPAYTPAWRPGAERRCHGPRRRRPARQTHGVRLGLPVSSHLVSLGTRGGHAGAAVAAGFGGVGRAGESPLPRIGPRGARRFDQGVARPGPEGPRRSGGPGVRRARSGGCVSVRWGRVGAAARRLLWRPCWSTSSCEIIRRRRSNSPSRPRRPGCRIVASPSRPSRGTSASDDHTVAKALRWFRSC